MRLNLSCSASHGLGGLPLMGQVCPRPARARPGVCCPGPHWLFTSGAGAGDGPVLTAGLMTGAAERGVAEPGVQQDSARKAVLPACAALSQGHITRKCCLVRFRLRQQRPRFQGTLNISPVVTSGQLSRLPRAKPAGMEWPDSGMAYGSGAWAFVGSAPLCALCKCCDVIAVHVPLVGQRAAGHV